MNMIEKVARAIATADEQNGGPPYDMLMTMGKHVRNGLYDRAKAAIEAMREPTTDVLDATMDWHNHVAMDENYPMARGVMRAAVDAAHWRASDVRHIRILEPAPMGPGC